eukprot:scpid2277/ scgid12202/ Chondroitin sulfate proteoglycan 4; Chondroitin sulfate proteoglycan NG2; Melanoma chondroitin sulfate proteoglycan; Melanoma-associated chondroitin sulfate proteoglycan
MRPSRTSAAANDKLSLLLGTCSLLAISLCCLTLVSGQTGGEGRQIVSTQCAECIIDNCAGEGAQQQCSEFDDGSGQTPDQPDPPSPELRTVSFHGEGFVRQDVSHVVSPDGSFSLSVLYRLSAAMASEDQLLFHITGADGADSLSLIVNHDRIRMLKNGQIRDDSIYGVQPARNEWHKIEFSFGGGAASTSRDGVFSIDNQPVDLVYAVINFKTLWVGGIAQADQSGLQGREFSNFHGCVHNLQVNNVLLQDNRVLQPPIPGLTYRQAARGADTHAVRHGCYQSTVSGQERRRSALSFQASNAFAALNHSLIVEPGKQSISLQFLAPHDGSGILLFQKLANGNTGILVDIVAPGNRVRLCVRGPSSAVRCATEDVLQVSAGWRELSLSVQPADAQHQYTSLRLLTGTTTRLTLELPALNLLSPGHLYLGGVDSGAHAEAKRLFEHSGPQVASPNLSPSKASFNGVVRLVKFDSRPVFVTFSALRSRAVREGYRPECSEQPCPTTQYTCSQVESAAVLLRYSCSCPDQSMCSADSADNEATPMPVPTAMPSWLSIQAAALRLAEGSKSIVSMTASTASGYTLDTGSLTGPYLPAGGSRVFMVITKPPQYGYFQLQTGERVTNRVPLATVLDGQLHYVHDGSESSSDDVRVDFVTAEELLLLSASVQIAIDPVDDPPHFVNVGPLTLASGSRLLVTSSILSAADDDNPAEDIIFNITSAMATADVPGHFKHRRNSGSQLIFSQADVDNNWILFVQSVPTRLTEFTVNITVANKLQQSAAPVVGQLKVLIAEARIDLTVPTGHLAVAFKQVTLLSSANLTLTTSFNHQKPKPKLHFIVVRPPMLGYFAYRGSDDDWKPVQNFSVAHVDNDRVAYVHIKESIETHDSAELAVGTGHYTQNKTFTVPMRVHLPFTPVQVAATVVLQPVNVREDMTVSFSADNVQIRYNPPSERNGKMEFVVQSVPSGGRLISGDVKLVRVNTVLPVSEVAGFTFIQLGSQSGDTVLGFCVRPIAATWPLDLKPPAESCGHELRIRITPVDDEPVEVRTGRIVVGEGSRAQLTNKTLLFRDEESTPAQLTFTFVDLPNGHFYKLPRHNQSVTRFTQEDINRGLVGFQHTLGKPLDGSLRFQLRDGYHVSSTYQLSINAIPLSIDVRQGAQRAVPVSAISGNPAGTGTLQTQHLPVFTSNPEQDVHLTFAISKPPRHGTVECIVQDSGDYTAVDSLTWSDLQSEQCRYRLSNLTTRKKVDAIRVTATIGKTSRHHLRVNVTIEPMPDISVRVSPTGLYIVQGSSAVLSTNEIAIVSQDVPLSQIFITAEYVSPFTKLQLTSSGIPVSRFSARELNAGSISYALEMTAPLDQVLHFKFFVTNGYRNTSSTQLAVTPYVDHIQLDSGVLVAGEGKTTDLTVDSLTARGPPEHSILLVITTPPQHGQLLSPTNTTGATALTEIPLEWLSNGRVQYVHDGSESPSDHFNFTAILRPVDSRSLVPAYTQDIAGSLNIAITPINDNPPHAVTTQGQLVKVNVVQYGQAILTSLYLQYTDADWDYDSDNLVYTVQLGPFHGTIAHSSSNNTASVPTTLTSFTQRDVNTNQVVYQHNGDNDTTDLLSFKVTDGKNDVRGALTFQITPLRLDFQLATLEMVEGGTHLLHAAFGEERVPGSFMQVTSNLERLNMDLLEFNVTENVKHGMLLNGGKQVTGGSSIVLKDLLQDNMVVYQHDDSDTSEDVFVLLPVYSRTAYPPLRVDIHIRQVDDTPPVLVNNEHIIVEDGGETTLGKDMLRAVDTEVPADELVYSVALAPSHGVLLVGNTTAQRFSQRDVDRSLVMYEHREGERLHDHFLLNLTDGHNAPIVVRVGVVALPARIPLLVNDMVVQEGGQTRLDKSTIIVDHAYLAHQAVSVQFLKLPVHGKLYVTSGEDMSNDAEVQEMHSVSLATIHHGQLIYKHGHSDNNSDMFQIQCSLGQRRSYNVTVHITVTPVNDQRPAQQSSEKPKLSVWYNVPATITSTVLKFVDADTLPSQLIYTASNLNNRQLVISGNTTDLTTFSQEQVDNGDVGVLVPAPIAGHDDEDAGNSQYLVFSMTDGVHKDVAVLNLYARALVLNVKAATGFTVQAGQSVVFIAHNLSVASNDPTTPYTYSFTLSSSPDRAPRHGYVAVNSSQATSFSSTDLNDGLVEYRHTDTESWAPRDRIELLVHGMDTPVSLSTRVVLHITIVHPTAENSNLAVNTPLTVVENHASVLSSSNLRSGNLRAKMANEHRLRVRNVAVLFSVVPGTPAHGALRSGATVNESVAVQEFTQDDVNDQELWYVHDGSESLRDQLGLLVQVRSLLDNAVLGSFNETLGVIITPLNDNPVNLSQFDDYLAVTQAMMTQLTADDVHLYDVDSSQETIHISVVLDAGSPSPFCVGSDPTAEFTKTDVDSGEVHFKAGDALGNYTYDLNVSDGVHTGQVTLLVEVIAQTLEITPAVEPVYIVQGSKQTTVTDVSLPVTTDSPDDEVLLNVTVPPKYGTLLISGGDDPVELFSLEELKSGSVQYHQSDMSQASDEFVVVAMNRFTQTDPAVTFIQVSALVKTSAEPEAFSFEDESIPVQQILDVSELVDKTSGPVYISIQQAPVYGAVVWREDNKQRRRRATQQQTIESFNSDDLANDRVVYVKNEQVPDGNYQDGFTAKLTAAGVQPAVARVDFTLDRDKAPSNGVEEPVRTAAPPSARTTAVEEEAASGNDDLLSQVIIPATVGGFLLLLIILVFIVLAMRGQRRRRMKVSNRPRKNTTSDIPRTNSSPVLTSHSHGSMGAMRTHSRVAISEVSTPTPPPPPLDEEEYRMTPSILEPAVNPPPPPPPAEAMGAPQTTITDGDYMQISATSTFAPRRTPPPTSSRDRSFTLPRNFNGSLQHQQPHSYLVPPRVSQRSCSDKNLANDGGLLAQSNHPIMSHRESAYAASATLPRVAASPPVSGSQLHDRHGGGGGAKLNGNSGSAGTVNSQESLGSASMAEYDRIYDKVFDKSSIHSSVSAVNKSGATALRKPEFWV